MNLKPQADFRRKEMLKYEKKSIAIRKGFYSKSYRKGLGLYVQKKFKR